MLQLCGARGVTGDVGQRQQVAATDEEVAVEVGHSQPLRAPHTHHGFEAGGARQVVHQVVVQPRAINVGVEAGVVVRLTTAVAGQLRQRRDVGVRLARQEHVDRDLLLAELQGDVLVVRAARRQQRVLQVATQHLRVLAMAQASGTLRRQRGLHHDHLAADVAHDLVGGLDSRAHGALHVACVGEHVWQRVQQSLHHVQRLRQVHQQVIRDGQEQVRDVRHDVHLRRGQGGLEVVEVHRAVEGDEADLGALRPWQQVLRHTLLDRRHRVLQHAAIHGLVADVDDKHVHRRLRRPHHVFRGRNDFHRALRQLRVVR